jgi:succinyl-CoA synthetase alpha subunit
LRRQDGRECVAHFRPGAGGCGRDDRSGERGCRSDRLHYRAHSAARHDQGQGCPEKTGVQLIDPNCPGIIQPARKTKLGIIPTGTHTPGKIGIVSRSRTLTYESSYATTLAGLRQSTVFGIGGDPFAGQLQTDVIKRFAAGAKTEGIILIGEIGGQSEEDAADWIAMNKLTKKS